MNSKQTFFTLLAAGYTNGVDIYKQSLAQIQSAQMPVVCNPDECQDMRFRVDWDDNGELIDCSTIQEESQKQMCEQQI